MAWARAASGAGEHDGLGDRHAGGAHDRLGPLLMHGKRRGEHA